MDRFRKGRVSYPLTGGLRQDISQDVLEVSSFSATKNIIYKKQSEAVSRDRIREVLETNSNENLNLMKYENQMLLSDNSSFKRIDLRERRDVFKSDFKRIETEYFPISQKERDVLYPSITRIGTLIYYGYVYNDSVFIKIFDTEQNTIVEQEVKFDDQMGIKGLSLFAVDSECYFAYITSSTVYVNRYGNTMAGRVFLRVSPENELVDFRVFMTPGTNQEALYYRIGYENPTVRRLNIHTPLTGITSVAGNQSLSFVPDREVVPTISENNSTTTLFGYRLWSSFSFNNETYRVVWTPHTGTFIIDANGNTLAKLNSGQVPIRDRSDILTFTESVTIGDDVFLPIFSSGQVEYDSGIVNRPIGVGLLKVKNELPNIQSSVLNRHMLISGSSINAYDGENFTEYGFSKRPQIRLGSGGVTFPERTQARIVPDLTKSSTTLNLNLTKERSDFNRSPFTFRAEETATFVGFGDGFGSTTSSRFLSTTGKFVDSVRFNKSINAIEIIFNDNTKLVGGFTIDGTYYKIDERTEVNNKSIGRHYTLVSPFVASTSYSIQVLPTDVSHNSTPLGEVDNANSIQASDVFFDEVYTHDQSMVGTTTTDTEKVFSLDTNEGSTSTLNRWVQATSGGTRTVTTDVGYGRIGLDEATSVNNKLVYGMGSNTIEIEAKERQALALTSSSSEYEGNIVLNGTGDSEDGDIDLSLSSTSLDFSRSDLSERAPSLSTSSNKITEFSLDFEDDEDIIPVDDTRYLFLLKRNGVLVSIGYNSTDREDEIEVRFWDDQLSWFVPPSVSDRDRGGYELEVYRSSSFNFDRDNQPEESDIFTTNYDYDLTLNNTNTLLTGLVGLPLNLQIVRSENQTIDIPFQIASGDITTTKAVKRLTSPPTDLVNLIGMESNFVGSTVYLEKTTEEEITNVLKEIALERGTQNDSIKILNNDENFSQYVGGMFTITIGALEYEFVLTTEDIVSNNEILKRLPANTISSQLLAATDGEVTLSRTVETPTTMTVVSSIVRNSHFTVEYQKANLEVEQLQQAITLQRTSDDSVSQVINFSNFKHLSGNNYIYSTDPNTLQTFPFTANTEALRFIYPEGTTTSTSIAIEFQNRTYGYQCLYKWIDSQGFEHRSVASEPLVVKSERDIGEENVVNLDLSTLGLTKKSGVSIEIYRTKRDSNVYRFAGEVLNDKVSQNVSFVDSITDDNLGATIDAFLRQFQPDGADNVALFQDRFCLAGFRTDPNKLIHSNPLSLAGNFGIAFDENQFIVLDSPIIAIRRMDSLLIIFTQDDIYRWSIDETEPTHISGSQNTAVADKNSVVETSQGIVFKSIKGIYLSN